jgi:hypothetical protein
MPTQDLIPLTGSHNCQKTGLEQGPSESGQPLDTTLSYGLFEKCKQKLPPAGHIC